MKRDEAQRRISALVEFHNAVGDVLRLTDFDYDRFGSAPPPKRGREQEWLTAKAKADRLVASAARSFALVNATIAYKPRGTWDQYPINPATHWGTLISDDPMFGPDLLDTMTNQAIGAYEDAVKNPPKRRAIRGEGVSVPSWIGALVVTVVGGLIVAGLAYWFGWVG